MRGVPYFRAELVAIAAPWLAATAVAGGYERAGWNTPFERTAHNVSGVVTIVDEDTIRLDHFDYDGGGLSVYLYLAEERTNPSFEAGLQIGEQLVGTVFDNDTLIVDLPAGQTLDGYNAVSVWCVVAGVSFGWGEFEPPCVGDLDGSGAVDLADLGLQLQAFGTVEGARPDQGDLDLDGDVDLADLAVLLGEFGAACA